MTYGLIGLKDRFEDQAVGLLGEASAEQEANERLGEQMDQAKRAQDQSTISSGAGMGLAVGMGSAKMGAAYGAWAGPVGMAAGAAIGFLATELF